MTLLPCPSVDLKILFGLAKTFYARPKYLDNVMVKKQKAIATMPKLSFNPAQYSLAMSKIYFGTKEEQDI